MRGKRHKRKLCDVVNEEGNKNKINVTENTRKIRRFEVHYQMNHDATQLQLRRGGCAMVSA